MKEVLDFISKDLKQYMEQNDLDFSDFESAALIYHSGLPILEIHKRLETLAAKTKDADLREQISEVLSVEKEDLKVFHENTKGFVYVVLALGTSDMPCGYFAMPESAYAHGRQLNCAFDINKYQIIVQEGAKIKKSKSYFNPYLMTEAVGIEELVKECDENGLTACLSYTQDGVLQNFWSQEIERGDENNLKRFFDRNLFTNAFIHMPNPFEKGDIVRLIPDGCRGIVNTSKEEWLKFLEEVDAGKLKACDFADASIIVECVYDKGDICHSHVSPAFLEKYEPQKDDDDFALLTAASALLRGRGGLDCFLHHYHAYKEKMKI